MQKIAQILLFLFAGIIILINLNTAPQQLSDVGFAAGNRSANPVAFLLNLGVIVATVRATVKGHEEKRLGPQAGWLFSLFFLTLILFFWSF